MSKERTLKTGSLSPVCTHEGCNKSAMYVADDLSQLCKKHALIWMRHHNAIYVGPKNKRPDGGKAP